MIGQPTSRVDGLLKVSGKATYAYEQWDTGQPLYGFIVGATVGKGHITRIDTERAEHSPGVRLVMTYQNAPQQGPRDDSLPEYWRAEPSLGSAEIRHYGDPVALVVATSYEEARAAAELVAVSYAVDEGHFDPDAHQDALAETEVVRGQRREGADRALAAAVDG